MAFFGLFGKKKEKKEDKDLPKAPIPPSTLKLGDSKPIGIEKDVKPPQHVDDFGADIGMKTEEMKMPKGLELPELEFPILDIPPLEEKEIKKAVEEKAKPTVKPMPKPLPKKEKPKKIPEKIPDIEHVPKPEVPKSKLKLATFEDPTELKAAPKAKGPVFIRSDQFKLIKTNISGLKEAMNKAEETLNNITEIKSMEDSEYEGWHNATEAIQRKLLYIDRMLFE